jgi:multidrug efflux pump
MSLTGIALKHRTTVYVAVVCIVIAGLLAYRALPLEAEPEVQIPIVLVSTIYPGVAPEDVERLVTNVLERELKDLDDLKEITSSSAESVSVIKIEFKTGVDLDGAFQKVRDEVDKAKSDLPSDVEAPMLIQINISDFPMMLVNVSGAYGLDKLKTVGDGLKDRFDQIPGVMEADLVGGLEREIQVYLDPARLEYYGLGVEQVIMRIQQEHRTTPAGNLPLHGMKYSVRIPGEYRDVSLMENIVLDAPGGNPVRLRDVGRVVDGHKEQESVSRIDGTECVTLRVKKQVGANIIDVADAVRATLHDAKPTLPAGTKIEILEDSSDYVRDTFDELQNTIISSIILVLGVLLFAMGVRNAIFAAIAVPISMLMSFIVLHALGITINMVVMFGFILVLGMLVDDSIVVVENIYRHASEGAPREKAALVATLEVAWPVITSTLTNMAVFAPLLLWPGIMGDFLKYMPITVIITLASSLLVALVINPVIAARFLKVRGRMTFDESGIATGRFSSRYQRFLRWSLAHPKTVLTAFAALLVGTIAIYARYNAGVEFFPNITPDRAQVTITAPQGTVLAQTDALVKKVEAIAHTEANVKTVVANVGTGGGWVDTGSAPSHAAVVNVEFKDADERVSSPWVTVESLRRKLKGLSGAEYRVDIPDMGPPTGAPVSIELSGPDYGVLSGLAAETRRLIASVKGVVDIKDDYEAGKPEIRVEVDREKAMLRQVNTAAISTAVRAAVNGIEASVLREGDETYDIVVRYDDAFRTSINDILDIRVAGGNDVQIPLRDVARVYTTGGFGSINHIDQQRTIAVTADVTGRSSSEVIPEIQKLLGAKLGRPSGYNVKYSGESQEQDEASAFLMKALLYGLMLIAIILITQFNSVIRPAIIMGSVVLSLIGVLICLLVTQTKFGVIMSGLGVISLAGVVVKNAIVLIDYTNILVEKRGLPLAEALARAGVVRLRPVILTAVAAVLGVLPIALGVSVDFKHFEIDVGSTSAEMWGPLALVIAFGLTFATVLTLIVVPVMYVAQENAANALGNVARRVRGRFSGSRAVNAEVEQ